MKIKTSNATPLQLNWLVGTIEKAEGLTYNDRTGKCYAYDRNGLMTGYSPSTMWAQGGPIIEREKISVIEGSNDEWQAGKRPYKFSYGPTPLIAAMRCYVASKLGDEVEVLDDLLCRCYTGPEWSGSPNPSNPDNEWVCDDCGRTIKAEVPDELV